MIVYGLAAVGYYIGTDSKNKIISRKLFHTKEEAEAHKPAFRLLCVSDGKGLNDMDATLPITIAIVEYELKDAD